MIDSGPESVFELVVTSIEQLGFRPENVRHLLASHIHLDHTDGAWRWTKEFGTQIYVHPKGAPHILVFQSQDIPDNLHTWARSASQCLLALKRKCRIRWGCGQCYHRRRPLRATISSSRYSSRILETVAGSDPGFAACLHLRYTFRED